MSTVRNTLISIAAGIASTRVAHMISGFGLENVIRPMGLSRRAGWPEKVAFLGAGIVVGGVTAILLAPASGQETRARIAKKAGELGDAASKQAREIGEHIRHEVSDHRPKLDNKPSLDRARV